MLLVLTWIEGDAICKVIMRWSDLCQILERRNNKRTFSPVRAKDTRRFRTLELREENEANDWDNKERKIRGVLNEWFDGYLWFDGLRAFTVATAYRAWVRWWYASAKTKETYQSPTVRRPPPGQS